MVPHLPGGMSVEDVNRVKELEFLRRELAKYKALKLTPEQKKQLGQPDFGEEFSKGDWTIFNFFSNQLDRLTNYGGTLLGTSSPTKIEEINNKDLPSARSKPLKSKSKKKNIKRKSSTDISCSIPKDSTSQSTSSQCGIADECESDSSSGSSRGYNYQFNKRKVNRNCTYDDESETSTDSNRSYIIKSESIIISLENELKAKESEVDELKSLSRDLKYSLQNRDMQIKNLKESLAKTQLNLQNTIDQRNNELDEWRQKLENSRNLIELMNRKLEEKRHQCYELVQEINHLKQDNNLQGLRTERDSLAKKLDEVAKLVKNAGNYGAGIEGMKALIRERNDLIEWKRQFEVHYSDQEYEIDRLNKLINRIEEERETQRLEMSRITEELEEELRNKSDEIDYYQEQINHYKEHTKQLKRELEKNNEAKEKDSMSDRDLDSTFAMYLKKSSEQIDQLSTALHGAGNDVEKSQKEIDILKKQISQSLYNEKLYQSQWEECQKQIDSQINEIEKLRQYNDKLNKDIQNNVNLKYELNEMTSKVASLQKEHSNLTNKLKHLNECLKAKNYEVISLQEEKQNLEKKIASILAELEEKNSKINLLEQENSEIYKKLQDTEKDVKEVSEEIQSIKYNDEKILQIKMLEQQLIKRSKEKSKLEDAVKDLRKEYTECKNLNKQLEDNLTNKSNQIIIIKRDIKRLTSDLSDNIYSDGSIIKFPDKFHESLSILMKHDELDSCNEKGSTDFNDIDCDNIKDREDSTSKALNNSDTDQLINSIVRENKDSAMKDDRAMLEEIKQNYKAALKPMLKNLSSCVAKKFDPQLFDNESGFISEGISSIKSPNDINNYHHHQLDSIPTYLNTIKLNQANQPDFNNDLSDNQSKNKHDDNRHNILSKYNNDKSRQRNIQFINSCCRRLNKKY
ncbi:putative leucine-rich repeat-containing protein DDB_G0290503 isoform X2 [Cotesia glomerata]|nr:putative leucine-rich repeat-containing protein DDB_G0290503 isoform X2 [Cotesia glomerata]